jgi:hypothetical protein
LATIKILGNKFKRRTTTATTPRYALVQVVTANFAIIVQYIEEKKRQYQEVGHCFSSFPE